MVNYENESLLLHLGVYYSDDVDLGQVSIEYGTVTDQPMMSFLMMSSMMSYYGGE